MTNTESMDSDIYLLTGDEIVALLKDREAELIEVIRDAYAVYSTGDESLPHSSFLRFPDNDSDRIISLIGYLGGQFQVAGTKWIASFPGNIQKNIERASAALILNSTENGRPFAFFESSVISAKRTAASAVLAATLLKEPETVTNIGLVGTGLINFEVSTFLQNKFPDAQTIRIFDLSKERGEQFMERYRDTIGDKEFILCSTVEEVLESSELISFATTAGTPYIKDIGMCKDDALILHVSLRDICEEAILRANNVVDDVDHVSRAQTSIHLAELQVGHRDFVNCNIGDLIAGKSRADFDKKVTIFSPFGLGVLDLALGKYVFDEGKKQGSGASLPAFFPVSWFERN